MGCRSVREGKSYARLVAAGVVRGGPTAEVESIALEAFQRKVWRIGNGEVKRNDNRNTKKHFKNAPILTFLSKNPPGGEIHNATHHRETVVGMFEE